MIGRLAWIGVCLAATWTGGCARAPAVPDEAPRDWARPLSAVRFAPSPLRIARGRYLAESVLQCSHCHSEPDRSRPGAPPLPGRAYAGRVFWDDSTIRLVAPNLTPDRATGAGAWTDDMLARAIREGVGHDGRALHPIMRYGAFRSLADEDLASVIAYMRSLPAVRNRLPASRLGDERRARLESGLEPLTEPVPMPDTVDAVARGRYYIGLADCVGCHTSWYTPYNPGLNAGGNLIERDWGNAFSSNITPDASGIGGLDSTGFIALLRTGRGGSMHEIMPWAWFGRLSDRDLGALHRALRTVQAAPHWISNNPPFTACGICGQTHGLGERNRRVRPAGVKVAPATLDAYAGLYRSEADDFALTVTREGSRLYGADEANVRVELIPAGGDRFLAPGWVAPVSFERDAAGRVVAMVSEELEPVRMARVN